MDVVRLNFGGTLRRCALVVVDSEQGAGGSVKSGGGPGKGVGSRSSGLLERWRLGCLARGRTGPRMGFRGGGGWREGAGSAVLPGPVRGLSDRPSFM